MTSQYQTERVENKYCYSKELLCDKTLPQLCDETSKDVSLKIDSMALR